MTTEDRPLPEWGEGSYKEPNDALGIRREVDESGTDEHIIVSCSARQYALWKQVEMNARKAGYGQIDREVFTQGLDDIFGVSFRQQLLGRHYSHLHIQVEP